MRKLRNCTSSQLNTGVSKCPPDFGKMKGAILVEPGTKLPADLKADALEKLAHANRPERIYGIGTFVEYAKNGGEVQTSAVGYGGEEITGVSARKDTYTLNRFYPELHAAITKCSSKEWDVYFYDENNILYGINDGTGVLAGFPLANVYSDATPHPTSSAKPTMDVTFSHADAKKSITDFDYVQLDFNPAKVILGLISVKLEKTGESGTKYKLYETVGGYDVTAIYGPLIAESGTNVVNGVTTAVTYNEDDETLTIAADGEVKLKNPSVLYENDIKGIEQVL